MSAGRPFRGCACFFTDNIFVARFGLHVRYRDGPQLRRDHGRALRERGCRSEEQFQEVLREVNKPSSPSLSSCSIPRIIPVPLDSLQQLLSRREMRSPDPLRAPLISGISTRRGSVPKGVWGLLEPHRTAGGSRHRVPIHRAESQGKNSLRAPISEIEAEVQRRKELIHKSEERRAIISKCYKPKHPEVYTLQDSFLAPEFLEIVRFCTSPGADLQGLLSHLESFSDKRIYRLPVFTEEFCQAFVDELENFEQSDMPKGRPNTMNNYGVLLNELGMDEPFLTPLRERLLPLTALLYPELGGACLDSHKAFVVKYSLHQDLDLSSHYDNAEVTLNVSLGKEFTEGNLYFGDFSQDAAPVPSYIEVEHVCGRGLLHRGGQIHGALPIASGERWNLIVWMRSSAIRNQLCPMCRRQPQLVEAEGFGDGFTEPPGEEEEPQSVDLCALA